MSTIQVTHITPQDLCKFINRKFTIDIGETLILEWFRNLHSYTLGQIIDCLFSKSDRIHICLRIIKEIKDGSETLYHRIEKLKDPGPLNTINACEAFIKGEIDDDMLYSAAIESNRSFSNYTGGGSTAAWAAGNAFVGWTGWPQSNCKQIFLEELENFDWTRLEKEIRGHNIFGE